MPFSRAPYNLVNFGGHPNKLIGHQDGLREGGFHGQFSLPCLDEYNVCSHLPRKSHTATFKPIDLSSEVEMGWRSRAHRKQKRRIRISKQLCEL